MEHYILYETFRTFYHKEETYRSSEHFLNLAEAEKWVQYERKRFSIMSDFQVKITKASPSSSNTVFLREQFQNNKIEFGDIIEFEGNLIYYVSKPDDFIKNGWITKKCLYFKWASDEIEKEMKKKGIEIYGWRNIIKSGSGGQSEDIDSYFKQGLIVATSHHLDWKDEEIKKKFPLAFFAVYHKVVIPNEKTIEIVLFVCIKKDK